MIFLLISGFCLAACSSPETRQVLEKEQELLALVQQQVRLQQALEQRCQFLAERVPDLRTCLPEELEATRQRLAGSTEELTTKIAFHKRPRWEQVLTQWWQRLRAWMDFSR